jgi:hypothetical protein
MTRDNGTRNKVVGYFAVYWGSLRLGKMHGYVVTTKPDGAEVIYKQSNKHGIGLSNTLMVDSTMAH